MKMKEQKIGENPDDYDRRSSVFVNVGDYHGTGYTQPVGSTSKKADKKWDSFEKDTKFK